MYDTWQDLKAHQLSAFRASSPVGADGEELAGHVEPGTTRGPSFSSDGLMLAAFFVIFLCPT